MTNPKETNQEKEKTQELKELLLDLIADDTFYNFFSCLSLACLEHSIELDSVGQALQAQCYRDITSIILKTHESSWVD